MRPEARLRINSPAVIHETLDGEVVVINLDSGAYFSLDSAAAEVWGRLDPRRSVEQIAAELAQRHGVPAAEAAATVLAFCTELVDEGLAVEAGPEDAAGLDVETETAASEPQQPSTLGVFPRPALQKFTDMQELLLLDPVHEVAEAGWPHRKPGAS